MTSKEINEKLEQLTKEIRQAKGANTKLEKRVAELEKQSKESKK